MSSLVREATERVGNSAAIVAAALVQQHTHNLLDGSASLAPDLLKRGCRCSGLTRARSSSSTVFIDRYDKNVIALAEYDDNSQAINDDACENRVEIGWK